MRKKEIGVYIAYVLDVDMNPPLTTYSFIRLGLQCSGRRSPYLAAQLMSVFSHSAWSDILAVIIFYHCYVDSFRTFPAGQ